MSRAKPANLEASIRQRLANRAEAMGEDFQIILVRYGLERLMYRLSRSRRAGEFTVKGAMMFVAWTGASYRPTRDLDLMMEASRSAGRLEGVFRDLCGIAVEPDGLVLAADTVKAEAIREDDVYGGIRISLQGRLGRAKIPLQVDVGFGDAVTPAAEVQPFPTLLDQPPPLLAMYPRESTIAEKFEVMVKLGLANSRMKDYCDVWMLARGFDFDGEVLTGAIRATFRRRKTTLPGGDAAGLSEAFAKDAAKRSQWAAFIRRTRLKGSVDADIRAVVEGLRAFLLPPTFAATGSKPFPWRWPKGGPWQAKGTAVA